MSWVNDLASVAGIPAGAATLAVAIYKACAAAEKAARPEALEDIGRILKDPSWSRSVRPAAIIERVFTWTFGERHLTWLCIRRSLTATATISLFLALVYHSMTGMEFISFGLVSNRVACLVTGKCSAFYISAEGLALGIVVSFLLCAALPDFLALLKTRLLVKFCNANGSTGGVMITLYDLTFSIFISLALAIGIKAGLTAAIFMTKIYSSDVIRELYLVVQLTVGTPHPPAISGYNYDVPASALIREVQDTYKAIFFPHDFPFLSFFPVFIGSTIFTSVWTVIILVSTTAIKFLIPLQRFTSWFFDVDRRPLQAIGIVSATLVMAVSFVWTILIHIL